LRKTWRNCAALTSFIYPQESPRKSRINDTKHLLKLFLKGDGLPQAWRVKAVM
jgi:hypothetical protein